MEGRSGVFMTRAARLPFCLASFCGMSPLAIEPLLAICLQFYLYDFTIDLIKRPSVIKLHEWDTLINLLVHMRYMLFTFIQSSAVNTNMQYVHQDNRI